ncbi:MAG: threonylcarbamoyl-AMP synthase [Verrucomicrobia bacterium]|nr:threonylcarbamoyl-AMP synthase [Deltaproteobacteria bacterium]
MNRSSAVFQATILLRSGGVVAFPTETVYGLGADAENDGAVHRIFSIKGRPADHPLIVHLADLNQIDRWARHVPDAAMRLAERFWPGPLTIILRRSRRVSDLVTGGLDTVGLRAPAHPVAQALLREFGGGIAAPSANRFGRISPTRAEHVRAELGTGPDLILDGGDCLVGLESTIISLAGERPLLLRPGAIGPGELSETIGAEVVIPEMPDSAERAPGCHASHYAPVTPARVVSKAVLPAEIERSNNGGQRIALLCMSNTEYEACQVAERLHMPGDPAGYGRALYASLRGVDAAGFDLILIEAPPDSEPWRAVRDRLQRASCHRSQA